LLSECATQSRHHHLAPLSLQSPALPPPAPPQFYNGFSGQALVDSITAAVFNVVFTSLPILLFSVLDRPVKNLRALIRYPKVCSAAGPGPVAWRRADASPGLQMGWQRARAAWGTRQLAGIGRARV